MPDPVVARVQCMVIEGADARTFAQAQFASDVGRLAPFHWQWSAWLDAKGRVLALMQLADTGEGTLLAALRGGDAATSCEQLARFRLRARVTLRACVFAGNASAAAPLGEVTLDGNTFQFGFGERSLRLSPAAARIDPAAADAWHRVDIIAGWPSLPPAVPQFLPPALSLARLGAVAFDKGCYPGQEIAARLHHRGGHKYRLAHLRGSAPLPLGTCASGSGEPRIEVLDAAFSHGSADALAVVCMPAPRKISVLRNDYDVVSIFDA